MAVPAILKVVVSRPAAERWSVIQSRHLCGDADAIRSMRALSIRQPYAELILRGIKTVEYRTRPTRIVGERFHIYAPLKKASAVPKAWSRDLAMPGDSLPEWMIELAEQVGMIEPGAQGGLPVGVIVGSAVIERVSRVDSVYRWHLADARRATRLRKPRGHPQPVWFNPF